MRVEGSLERCSFEDGSLNHAPTPAKLGLALLAGLLVAACNGGAGSTDTPTPIPPTATGVAIPPATATPTAGPTLLDANPDGERALEHVRALSVDIGVRRAGTPQEIEAARYIADRLRSYGYEVDEQPFPFESEFFREASLERTSPEPAPIGAIPLARSAEGEASGTLAFVGIGRREDFPAEGIAGRVALMERGDLFFSDKVANAADAGAAAAIIFNNEAGAFAGALEERSAIPVVGISGEEGAALLALLDQGPVEVSLEVGPALQGTARNVIARPTGQPETRCETVSGGHYDTTPFGPGANDNASGTAAVLELARVVKARGLSGNHCFVLFGAEEIGLLGSGAFVASLPEGDRQALRGMLNFDVVSSGEHWELIGSPGLVEIAVEAAQSAGIRVEPSEQLDGMGSDHQSFIAAGVPSIHFIRTGGDFLSELIHTPQDTIEIVRPADLEEVVTLGALVLAALEEGE